MHVLYYVSMLWCWHLIWILVRTDHPCLGVGCHSAACVSLRAFSFTYHLISTAWTLMYRIKTFKL
jgi:hypothetical protein